MKIEPKSLSPAEIKALLALVASLPDPSPWAHLKLSEEDYQSAVRTTVGDRELLAVIRDLAEALAGLEKAVFRPATSPETALNYRLLADAATKEAALFALGDCPQFVEQWKAARTSAFAYSEVNAYHMIASGHGPLAAACGMAATAGRIAVGFTSPQNAIHQLDDAIRSGMAVSLGHVPPKFTSAIDEIAKERLRQIEVEGWSEEHDDEYSNGEMAAAAASYALISRSGLGGAHRAAFPPQKPIHYWPWSNDWWKPTTPRHDLIRAGALIVAEIQRLDRMTTRGEG